jgi:hypothetical protein
VDAPNVVRFVVDNQIVQFRPGEYHVALFGDPGPLRPAIARPDASRLDGERQPTYPSGDGTPGGVFEFKFAVQ